MEKQLTAVEWLINQLKNQYDIDIERFAITDEAKEMEKEKKYTEQEMIEYGRFCVQCHEQGFIIPKFNKQ